jgi:hypothetical protein
VISFDKGHVSSLGYKTSTGDLIERNQQVHGEAETDTGILLRKA